MAAPYKLPVGRSVTQVLEPDDSKPEDSYGAEPVDFLQPGTSGLFDGVKAKGFDDEEFVDDGSWDDEDLDPANQEDFED